MTWRPRYTCDRCGRTLKYCSPDGCCWPNCEAAALKAIRRAAGVMVGAYGRWARRALKELGLLQ